MNDTAISDAQIFAHWAGTDTARWETLVGQRVTHNTLGPGTVAEIGRDSAGSMLVCVRFANEPATLRRFNIPVFSNPSRFPEVEIPAVLPDREALREQVRAQRQQTATLRERASPASRQGTTASIQTVQVASRPAPARRIESLGRRTEVISIPAGRTTPYIRAYDVHACPDRYRQYRDTPYMTFRATGGIMHRVYDMGACYIFTLNPDAPSATREQTIARLPLDEGAKERVRRYIADRLRDNQFKNKRGEEYRFYVFSQALQHIIDLDHRPRLEHNFESHTYFALDELTSGREIVRKLE